MSQGQVTSAGLPVGTIVGFGLSDFVPKGYVACEGQQLKINQLSDLFAVIKYTFGGSGNTYFLPDLRGAACRGAGQQPGGAMYTVGQAGGTITVALTQQNLPAHQHQMQVAIKSSDTPISALPTGNYPARVDILKKMYSSVPGPADDDLLKQPEITLGAYGGNAAIGIQNPYLPVRYCIKHDPYEVG